MEDDPPTCILYSGSASSDARLNKWAYSIYSTMRWRKLSGSLNITGIVILLSSFPIQFFRTDQIEKSLRLNIGTGSSCLKTQKCTTVKHVILITACFQVYENRNGKEREKKFHSRMHYKCLQ
jgi:hypothetical protein